jgi:hypothetical protein
MYRKSIKHGKNMNKIIIKRKTIISIITKMKIEITAATTEAEAVIEEEEVTVEVEEVC